MGRQNNHPFARLKSLVKVLLAHPIDVLQNVLVKRSAPDPRQLGHHGPRVHERQPPASCAELSQVSVAIELPAVTRRQEPNQKPSNFPQALHPAQRYFCQNLKQGEQGEVTDLKES
jgi:hypothetical protein